MIKGLAASLSLAGLVAVFGATGAVAAPIAPPVPAAVAPHGQSIEPVYYYYHGRRYTYRYNNRYYAHRVYRHNHWRYY
jgi:hypothetical protein